MYSEKLSKADDEHDRSILDIDNIVIADLRHNVPQCLRQDHVKHGLKMCHTDGLRAFCLSRINGNNTAPDGLRHVCACINGNHQKRRCPYTGKADRTVGKIRQSIINENCLQYHRRTAENFYVNSNDSPDQFQKKTFQQRIIFLIRDRLQDTTEEANETSDKRC